MRDYYVYIMSNHSCTLYTGFTSNLVARVWKHKHKVYDGFTKKYNITKLVYYETTTDVRAAIEREKQIKDWRRSKKVALIKIQNPTWRDLSSDFDEEALDSSLSGKLRSPVKGPLSAAIRPDEKTGSE